MSAHEVHGGFWREGEGDEADAGGGELNGGRGSAHGGR